ncbi:hypothetical protein BOX15_Mlig008582g3, partial [Macrostomum lignano]
CSLCYWSGIVAAALGAASLLFSLCYWLVLNRILPSNKLNPRGGHFVVSGGSSGIGFALCRRLRRLGAHLTIVARDAKKLAVAKAELLADSPELSESEAAIYLLSIDLTGDPDKLQADLDSHLATVTQPLLGVVNCAGYALPLEFEQLSLAQHESQMATNYTAAMRLTHCLLPRLLASGQPARIAFLSSVAGQLGVYGYTGYGAAKFALRGLAEALQMELAGSQVRLVLAFPPDTDTPGYQTENASKPAITASISANISLYSADQIAEQLVKDLIDGRFLSCFGSDGWLVGCLTAGFSPPTGWLDTMAQCGLGGLFRVIGLVYLKSLYQLVRDGKRAAAATDKKSD